MIGRPRKEISQKQFEQLCAIQCTQEEICSVLDVSDKTLTKWCLEVYGLAFSEVFKEKRCLGKASLRRSQWKLAEKNPTMSIWLGKQYLNQTDKQEIHSSNINTNKNIELSHLSTEEIKGLLKNED